MYALNQIQLVCYEDRAYQYVVEASLDGSTFRTIVDRSDNATPGSNSSPISDSITPTNARYVRIAVSGANSYSGSWVSLEELRVFGEEIDTPLDPEEPIEGLIPSDLMDNCNQWKITYPDGEEDKTLCGEPNNEYFYVDENILAIMKLHHQAA